MKEIKNNKYGPGTIVITTKDNIEHIGWLSKFKPEDNYIEICSGLVTIKICFDNIKTAVEYGARITINSPPEGEEDDLLKRAKDELKEGREHNWFNKEVPIRKWENE